MPSTPRTVLRSVRMPPRIAEVLAADASDRGVSVNALVTQILTKYADWDRFAERLGFVTITRDGYRMAHEVIPDDRLEAVAEAAGSTFPKEVALFIFKRLGPATFVEYLRLMTRYGGWAEIDVTPGARGTDIVLRHGLGAKYSRFLGRFLDAAAREIAGATVRCEVHPGSVVLRLPTAR